MSLKLVLAWLCFVLMRFGVVLGGTIVLSASSDEIRLASISKLWFDTIYELLGNIPYVGKDEFHLSGLDSFNSEMPQHQIHIMRERMTTCLEWMRIMVQPLIGNRLIESRNPDGTIGWILEMNSKKDRMRMVEDMQVYELIDYLSTVTKIPGVYKVGIIYFDQTLKLGTNGLYIPPTPKPTSTKPNEESIIYKQCQEDLQPLKKITSPDLIRIVGETKENEMLDQLELLLFLLRITDVPTIEIDWTDVSTAPLDVKLIDRFKPLLENIPAELKKKELVIKIATLCNHVFWGAFSEFIREDYEINPVCKILSSAAA
ncbi:hypothetical protein NEHOM01_1913 [Nematocida homosporus]|uniref:uncharacterized protein n=1 Tax=Nematocida homosporus TaxID=1912981 RepID=UPI0022205E6A|nr:uncharacterized protein NEHOM01_1913 [Nematocida homosporus]KAI5187080.1 hypothetical protein NEHOM01_1913 [Nematocida homosporus]